MIGLINNRSVQISTYCQTGNFINTVGCGTDRDCCCCCKKNIITGINLVLPVTLLVSHTGAKLTGCRVMDGPGVGGVLKGYPSQNQNH